MINQSNLGRVSLATEVAPLLIFWAFVKKKVESKAAKNPGLAIDEKINDNADSFTVFL